MLRLYPEVKVKRQSFIGHKVHTIPSQCMTLRDIIIRFTRKESLPVEKQGVYIDNMGDLEKAQHEDITVKHERAELLRDKIAKGKAAAKLREEEAAERKKALESAASNAQTPQGSVTGSVGAVQAPVPSLSPAKPGNAA